MQRYAWRAHIADGMIGEYKKRHDEIWPDMVAMLRAAGIQNYSIWNVGNEIFAYYECTIEHQRSLEIQKNSDIGRRWNKYMDGILILDDKSGVVDLTQVFLLE